MKLMPFVLTAILYSLFSYAQTENQIEQDADTEVLQEQIFEIYITEEMESFARDYYYDFGRVRVQRSVSAIFYFTNEGRLPIYMNSVDIDGASYSAKDNCPRLLFAGQSCRARVTFRPLSRGDHRGQLEFDLSGNQDIKVHLRGRGVRF